MSTYKMTREERLKSGWLEKFVIKSFRLSATECIYIARGDINPVAINSNLVWNNYENAFKFQDRVDAFSWIVEFHNWNKSHGRPSIAANLQIVTRWVRPKPKSKFKFGDKVIMRGTVNDLGDIAGGFVGVSFNAGDWVLAVRNVELVK